MESLEDLDLFNMRKKMKPRQQSPPWTERLIMESHSVSVNSRRREQERQVKSDSLTYLPTNCLKDLMKKRSKPNLSCLVLLHHSNMRLTKTTLSLTLTVMNRRKLQLMA